VNSQLDSDLKTLLSNLKMAGFFYEYNYFTICYYTGIRINELKKIYSWELTSGGFIAIPTLKKNLVRFINTETIPQLTIDFIFNANHNIGLRSYSSLRQTFIRHLPAIYTLDSKMICTHLFRHNYLKMLDSEGKSLPEIQHILGYNFAVTSYQYINSNLTRHENKQSYIAATKA
jgi:hypothetical protein